VQLFGGKVVEFAQGEVPFQGRIATAAVEAADLHLLAANRATANDRIHTYISLKL
jgi:hypothetical protein